MGWLPSFWSLFDFLGEYWSMWKNWFWVNTTVHAISTHELHYFPIPYSPTKVPMCMDGHWWDGFLVFDPYFMTSIKIGCLFLIKVSLMLFPTGMLECWNTGKMGLRMQQQWINGKMHLDAMLKMDSFRWKPTIPSFHYSIIPWLKKKLRYQKISCIFSKSYKL